jgi:predicted Zn-dependent protease with MMP-like domain
MHVGRFSALVDEAVASIPEEFRARFENIAIDVHPFASPELCRSMGRSRWELLGVYQGIPYGQRGPYYGNVLPDRILIFQTPIERMARTDADVRRLVRRVVIHEVGHYFGLSDEELHRLEGEASRDEEGPGMAPSPQ